MDNYNVFEEIGRGKYSTVYKGRKKKSFRCCAIKRVDKSHKNKALQEVEILQSLDDSKVLKCYDWYETCDELWLILEYCGGGDLRRLLKKDGKLPEDSVYDLARELVSGLRYLHSKGIIYCDLKPSNILLDEKGHTKLGDFGLSRKLSDISKTPSSLRGSPSYMAPELFRDGGVPSYACDIWALGCVLYECYAGRPPFIGKEFTQLASSILSDPTPSLPGSPSRPFADLVSSLLIKDPTDRITYWRTQFLTEDNPQNKTPRNNSSSKLKKTPKKRKIQLKEKGVSSNYTAGVDLLRLSRIAKSNLQRENDKENPLQNIVLENDATDVKIEDTDMELDFNENTEEDETQDEATSLPDATPTTVDENLSSKPDQQEERPLIHGIDSSPAIINTTDESRRSEEHESEVPATASPQPKTQTTVDADDSGGAVTEKKPVLFHPSDLSVQPVMLPSKKSNKQLDLLKLKLPFDAIPSSDFVKLPKDQLDDFTKSIVAILKRKARISEKQKVIRYLELISTDHEAANILTNGSIMVNLVEMLKQSKEASFRVQLASLFGSLICHSTFINVDVSSSVILGALKEGLVDRLEKVRRSLAAALGELLLYISKATNPPLETTSKESKTSSSSGWQDPSILISLVTSLLKKGEDDTTQLCALRTIENISSQEGYWSTCFTTKDVINNLCYIFQAPGKHENIRVTAGSCLVRLVRFTPPTLIHVMEKLTFKETAKAIAISSKQNPQEQQICLNLLNMALVTADEFFPDIGDHLLPLLEDENLVPGIVSLVANGGEVLQGKSLLFVKFVCENGGDRNRWLGKFFLNKRLSSTVDEIMEKDTGDYLLGCLEMFVEGMVSRFMELLDGLVTDVQMGGRGSTSDKSTNLHLLPVVPNILQIYPFKYILVNVEVLNKLKLLLIKLVESPFKGKDDYHLSVVRALRTVTADVSFVDHNWKIFFYGILPSVSTIYKGGKSKAVRFFCLKIWYDVLVNMLYESSSSLYKEDLTQTCISHFLPIYQRLLDDDEDSIPLIARKLHQILVEFEII